MRYKIRKNQKSVWVLTLRENKKRVYVLNFSKIILNKFHNNDLNTFSAKKMAREMNANFKEGKSQSLCFMKRNNFLVRFIRQHMLANLDKLFLQI